MYENEDELFYPTALIGEFEHSDDYGDTIKLELFADGSSHVEITGVNRSVMLSTEATLALALGILTQAFGLEVVQP